MAEHRNTCVGCLVASLFNQCVCGVLLFDIQ